MPTSTFEMTSLDQLQTARSYLDEAGFVSIEVPNRKSSTGPWLEVTHSDDQLGYVRNLVFDTDAAAIHQH